MKITDLVQRMPRNIYLHYKQSYIDPDFKKIYSVVYHVLWKVAVLHAYRRMYTPLGPKELRIAFVQ